MVTIEGHIFTDTQERFVGDPLYLETQAITPGVNLVWGGFGKHYDNHEILEYILSLDSNLDPARIQETINNSGFKGRFHDKRLISSDPKDYIEAEIQIGVNTLRKILEVQGWRPSDVDYLAMSNSALPHPYLLDMIMDTLGIDCPHRTYVGACGAAGIATLDAAKEPSLKGKNIIVMPIEGVSKGVAKGQHIDHMVDPVSLIYFSNTVAALGFRGGDLTIQNDIDIFRTFPDNKKSLTAPNLYPLPTYIDGNDPGLWVPMDEASVLTMPEEGDGINRLRMKGKLTATTFARLTAPIIVEAIQLASDCDPDRPITHIVSHKPSLGVETLTNGLVEKELSKKGLLMPQNPWMMDSTKMGNGVSATIFVNMAAQSQAGILPVNYPFLFVSYGAGISVRVAQIQLNG